VTSGCDIFHPNLTAKSDTRVTRNLFGRENDSCARVTSGCDIFHPKLPTKSHTRVTQNILVVYKSELQ
jgi:hypothetical protein